MDIIKLLEELTQEAGISGYEADFAVSVCKRLKTYCDDVKINKTGSVIGMLKKRDEAKKTVLLEAHLDRIGLVVSECEENGFVRFKPLGGIDERTLPASEVYILGKERIYGVIGALPPHLKSVANENVGYCDMMIDTGLSTADTKEKISVGDPILLKSELVRLNGGIVASGALDNRAGMAAIFECLDILKDRDLLYNIQVAFTSGEELGLHGARTLSGLDAPDLAVVVDVTHGKTHDFVGSEAFSLGAGAIICKGPNLHYDFTNRFVSLAEEKGILYDVEVAAGSSGTNAWALQTAGNGIPCVLVSVPLRYMHTAVETVDTADIEGVARLLAEAIGGGDIFA